MLLYSSLALVVGFVLDLLVGDPRGWPHLARLIGLLISRLELLFYPMANKRLGGMLLAVTVLLVCTAAPTALLCLAYLASPWLFFGLEAILCWQLLATKSLRLESAAVYQALKAGELPQAREALSWIVGRDTAGLDAAGVTRAAVETVAENTSDGVVAPLFFLMLGAAPLGCLYKAANTMDSMIAYKNQRYLDFGRFAARLDDALNYLPSRLSAILMIAAALVLRLDAQGAKRIWRRDRLKHASPNSAQTESAMAGALGIRLAGDASYSGRPHSKPFIGDDTRPIIPEDIRASHKLLYATAVIMLVLVIIVRGIFYVAL